MSDSLDSTKEECIEYQRNALAGDDAGQYAISVIEDKFAALKMENEGLREAIKNTLLTEMGEPIGIVGRQELHDALLKGEDDE